jgi:hypothetical protein
MSSNTDRRQTVASTLIVRVPSNSLGMGHTESSTLNCNTGGGADGARSHAALVHNHRQQQQFGAQCKHSLFHNTDMVFRPTVSSGPCHAGIIVPVQRHSLCDIESRRPCGSLASGLGSAAWGSHDGQVPVICV